MKPSVSVIIPTLNSTIIEQTLDSLLRQTCQDQIVEILVIGLDEGNLVKERGPIRFISTKKQVWAPVSRNIGIKQAQGDLLAFLDDDCVATPNWLEKLLQSQDGTRPVVAGSVSLETQNYKSLCYNLALFSDMMAISSAGLRASVPSLNLMIECQVFEHVGLFDETLPRSHDVELSCRIRRGGYEIYFTPDAQIIHLPQPKDWRVVFRKFYRSGFYSTRVRLACRDMLDTPKIFDHPTLFLTLSPLLSAGTLLRTFGQTKLWRYLHAAPMIFACKMAWCLGAYAQIKAQRSHA